MTTNKSIEPNNHTLHNTLENIVSEKLNAKDYRGAVESILETMRSLSEEKNLELSSEIDAALSKVFDLPNIDWNSL